MTIVELVDASTIIFDNPLTLEEMGTLLNYIAMELPASINTSTTYSEQRSNNNGNLISKRGSVEVGGTITNRSNGDFDRFRTYTLPENEIGQISRMRFKIIPGYQLEEHSKTSRRLWKEVKIQVNRYLDQKQ
jgi:hypothetical protein|tara:strand:- start:335 stop:730 length:396 start_codon:yes stop_codon:yes gene_type:complete